MAKCNKRKDHAGCWVIIGFVIVAVLAWLQVWFALTAKDKFNIIPNEFGDSFGAMNAVISGLAFVALVFTLVMQSRELRLQREELEDTREELRGSRKAQEAQVQMSLQSARIASLAAILNHKYHQLTVHPTLTSSINIDINRWNAELEAEITGIHYTGQPWLAANSMIHQAATEITNAQKSTPPISFPLDIPEDLPKGLKDGLKKVEDLLSLSHGLKSSDGTVELSDSDDPLKPIVRAWLFKAKECLQLGIRQEELVLEEAGDADD